MARKMKDSGIEWIGEIPEDWEVRKIKSSFNLFAGATPKSENADFFDGDIVWITPADYKTADKYVSVGRRNLSTQGYESCGTTLVPAGSIVFSKRAPIGSVAIAKTELCTNQGCISCVTKGDVDPEYFYYAMSVFTDEFNLLGTGTTFKEISANAFANFQLPFPSIQEQHRISTFLQLRCNYIDSILERTRSSIDEYKKLKQAVITQAVTKGVRGDRPMKDSGMNNNVAIPEEWNAVISRFVIDSIGDVDHTMPESTENGYPYLMIGDLKSYTSEIDFEKAKKISEEDYKQLIKKTKPLEGDVIFARYATIGTVTYIDTDNEFVVSYACVTVHPKRDALLGKYLFYYFKSETFFDDVQQYINSNTQGNVGIEALFKTKIVVPTLEEQIEIVEYLDSKCAAIDSLIAQKEKFLLELEDYKKSMIYEYVTGKKEVPNG